MKGIFFSQINTDKKYQGAVQKVFDEINAFREVGFEVRHVNFTPVSSGIRSKHFGKGFCASLPFTYVFSKYIYAPSFDGYDFYYFRFEAADRWMIRLLRELRVHNPSSRIIIELPNFPQNAWLVMPWGVGLLLKDMAARKQYRKYVDRFVALDPDYSEIYGVTSITYMNGIDVSRIPMRRFFGKAKDGRIDIVGVATMFPSHGYDRLIESLNAYYRAGGGRNIVFHVVGEGPGPELKKYKDMVNKYRLSEHVIFEGTLVGKELTECYNKCDLALDDLCGFRMGINDSSSLKSREYLAYGLPIIAACNIDIFKGKDYKYLLKLENNDSIIDIDTIVDFYDRIYGSESMESVIGNIRRFAEENCSYVVTLGNVISYIRGESNGEEKA